MPTHKKITYILDHNFNKFNLYWEDNLYLGFAHLIGGSWVFRFSRNIADTNFASASLLNLTEVMYVLNGSDLRQLPINNQQPETNYEY